MVMRPRWRRAIPELWPWTEALALAMEVSVLEAKRLRQRGVLVLSWVLLVASVALSTLLQIAVAPPSLVGYLTAGATPVWLLGSFAVLSLLYRTPGPAADAAVGVEAARPRRKRERAARRTPPWSLPASCAWRPLAEGRRVSADQGGRAGRVQCRHHLAAQQRQRPSGCRAIPTIGGPGPSCYGSLRQTTTRAASGSTLAGLPQAAYRAPTHRAGQPPPPGAAPGLALGVAGSAPPARRVGAAGAGPRHEHQDDSTPSAGAEGRANGTTQAHQWRRAGAIRGTIAPSFARPRHQLSPRAAACKIRRALRAKYGL